MNSDGEPTTRAEFLARVNAKLHHPGWSIVDKLERRGWVVLPPGVVPGDDLERSLRALAGDADDEDEEV